MLLVEESILQGIKIIAAKVCSVTTVFHRMNDVYVVQKINKAAIHCCFLTFMGLQKNLVLIYKIIKKYSRNSLCFYFCTNRLKNRYRVKYRVLKDTYF